MCVYIYYIYSVKGLYWAFVFASVFRGQILQRMPCAAIFLKDYIPCIKWHHFVQSPNIKELQHFFERNIRLFLKRLTVLKR